MRLTVVFRVYIVIQHLRPQMCVMTVFGMCTEVCIRQKLLRPAKRHYRSPTTIITI